MALDRELSTALRLAGEAGDLALSLRGRVGEERKADATPVSEADRRCDALLRAGLAQAFPDDGLLTEETADDGTRLACRRIWIVDPIDGTRDFLDGRDEWAVQIGLAEAGVPVLGVVALPALGLILAGRPGQGASLHHRDGTSVPLHVPADLPRRLIASRSSRTREALVRIRTVLADHDLVRCSSVGRKVHEILAGRAGLYLHPTSIHEWDVAGPAAVALAAGLAASDLAGAALRFNTPAAEVSGLAIGEPGLHAAALARLAEAS